MYKNEALVHKACEILIAKLQNIHDTIENEGVIEKSITTIPNSMDINLKNTGYTVGKIIEFMLHKNNYQGEQDKNLTYVGFRKNHPHDDDSVIRIGMVDRGDNEGYKEVAVANTRSACNDAIQVLSDIMSEFS